MRTLAVVLFSLATLVAAIALFAPVPQGFHRGPLDDSWVLAMNEAAAEAKVFGREIQFTFGPYAAADTREFHPALDRVTVLVDLLFGLGYGMGLLCLGRRKPWRALGAPILMFLTMEWREPLFLTYPLLHLLVTDQVMDGIGRRRTPGSALPLCVLAGLTVALGFLPLVKGSFAIVTVLLGGSAFLLAWRTRRALAWAGLALFLSALIGGWVASGQPIAALPGYFIALVPIITGYSEGMAIWNNEREAMLYAAVAAVLVLSCGLRFLRQRDAAGFLVTLGTALTLFLAMKEGFVRHDLHALIAATSLVAVGLLVSFRLSAGWAIALIALAILGWAGIAQHYMPLTPGYVVARAEVTADQFGAAIRDRLDHLAAARYDADMAELRAKYPLIDRGGTTDIYPIDQEILIAHRFKWSPRPVIQSYSAYNPTLAALDAAHLTGPDAPDFVYFRPGTIDGRFPTLDDGPSWPLLATRYRVIAKEAGFAVLQRNPDAPTTGALAGDAIEVTTQFGQPVVLPVEPTPLWAEIDVRPTLLGRLVGLLYKLPNLYLDATFADGRRAHYRYIPAMGRAGFLISPVVQSTEQFLALLSPYRQSLLASERPTTIGLAPDSWAQHLATWFWQPSIPVRLRRFDPPSQAMAGTLLFDPLLDQSPAGLSADSSTAGACYLDKLRLRPIGDPGDGSPHTLLEAEGWSVISTTDGIAPDDIFVTVTDPAGTIRIAKARKTDRPDVNAHFQHLDMGPVGFAATVDLGRFDTGTLRIAESRDGSFFYCPDARPLTLEPDPIRSIRPER